MRSGLLGAKSSVRVRAQLQCDHVTLGLICLRRLHHFVALYAEATFLGGGTCTGGRVVPEVECTPFHAPADPITDRLLEVAFVAGNALLRVHGPEVAGLALAVLPPGFPRALDGGLPWRAGARHRVVLHAVVS